MVTSPGLRDIDEKEKASILGKPSSIVIPFNKPCFFPECGDYIQKAFDNGKLSGDGLNSHLCTKWFADRFGYHRALLTPSCTAALEMTALLLELGPGDEVIVPSFTFVSTANAFALRGASLVFVDSGKSHPNVNVNDLLQKIMKQTKAIVVVHYAGAPVDVTRLVATGIPVIEDCAHAIGTFDPFTRDYIGKTSFASTFSFHETKNVGIGEGGMIVINNPAVWERAQIIREKGTNRTAFRENRADFYTWHTLGSSYLMSDVNAGVLIGCLEHFDDIQRRRQEIWDQYSRRISESALFAKPRPEDRFNAHMYYLQFYQASKLFQFTEFMKSKGILLATHYRPLDQSPFVTAISEETTPHCKNSEQWSNSLVRLPLFYGLSLVNVDKIAAAINSFAGSESLLELVPAEHQHYEAIRIIRNQHKESFWTVEEIDSKTHQRFMTKHAKTYRVAIDVDSTVVGFIGQVDGDVRLATRKDRMRSGVASFMWERFLAEFPDGLTVKVKRENKRSLAFFEKWGWEVDAWQREIGTDPVSLVTKQQTHESRAKAGTKGKTT